MKPSTPIRPMAQGGADDHWLARPETVRLLRALFGVILVGMLVLDPFVHQHADFGVEDTFAFYAWYGFASCGVFVLVAKALSFLLKRSDRYYGG